MQTEPFNPTLVLFQPNPLKFLPPPVHAFNPTLVLFQQGNREGGADRRAAFNPTLVLFQQNNHLPDGISGKPAFNPTLVLFQPVNCTLSSAVSGAFNPTLVLFQRAQLIVHCPRCHLSIPLWSYFNSLKNTETRYVDCSFQSHFGLISTSHTWRGILHWMRFQSHFGLISTSSGAANGSRDTHFQSHFGLISTELEPPELAASETAFNPTLVLFQRMLGGAQS